MPVRKAQHVRRASLVDLARTHDTSRRILISRDTQNGADRDRLAELRADALEAPSSVRSLTMSPRARWHIAAGLIVGGAIAVPLPLIASHRGWSWYDVYWEGLLITLGLGIALWLHVSCAAASHRPGDP